MADADSNIYELSDAGTIGGVPIGSGSSSSPAVTEATGAFAFTGDISPAQITANQNDYNPTGLSGASTLRINSDAARSLTGLAGGADGRFVLVHNVGAFAITLVDESASSTAGNRFALTSDLVLAADTGALLQYDSTSSRWRALGGDGIKSLNALTGAAQTIVLGTAGFGNSISSVGSTHTINLPDANGSFRGAVSAGTQTLGGIKSFAADIVALDDVVVANGGRFLSFAATSGVVWPSVAGKDIGLFRSAANILEVDNGTVGTYAWLRQGGHKRVTAQFDKTSDTTLANVTGLSETVIAGRTYKFEALLYTTSNVAGGVNFAIGGTATATAVIYEALVFDGAAVSAQTRAAALAGAVGGVTAVTAAHAKICGTITVNAGGTLTVQFAQNASNATASSVLVGSTFTLTDAT